MASTNVTKDHNQIGDNCALPFSTSDSTERAQSVSKKRCSPFLLGKHIFSNSKNTAYKCGDGGTIKTAEPLNSSAQLKWQQGLSLPWQAGLGYESLVSSFFYICYRHRVLKVHNGVFSSRLFSGHHLDQVAITANAKFSVVVLSLRHSPVGQASFSIIHSVRAFCYT